MDVKQIVKALKDVSPAIAKDDVLPVLSHYCFDGSGVYAYNDMIAMRRPVSGFGGFEGAVSKDILKVLSAASQNASVDTSKSSLTVKDGRSKAALAFLDPEEFLFKQPDLSGATPIRVEEDLVWGLEYAMRSVDQKSKDATINAVIISADCISATDNISLTRWMLDERLPIDGLSTGSIVVPSPFVKHLLNWCNNDCDLYLSEDHCVALFDDGSMLFTKVLTDEALDFDGVIDSYHNPYDEYSVSVNNGLISRLKFIKQLVTDVNVVLEDGAITVTGNSDTAEVEEVFDVDYDGRKILFNMEVESLVRAFEMSDEAFFNEGCLSTFIGDKLLHLSLYK